MRLSQGGSSWRTVRALGPASVGLSAAVMVLFLLHIRTNHTALQQSWAFLSWGSKIILWTLHPTQGKRSIIVKLSSFLDVVKSLYLSCSVHTAFGFLISVTLGHRNAFFFLNISCTLLKSSSSRTLHLYGVDDFDFRYSVFHWKHVHT